MIFKYVFFLAIISSINLNATYYELMPGKYKIDIELTDSKESYPAILEFNINDSGTFLSGNIQYPTYGCQANLHSLNNNQNTINIIEKMKIGYDSCPSSEYTIKVNPQYSFQPTNIKYIRFKMFDGEENVEVKLVKYTYLKNRYANYRIKNKIKNLNEIFTSTNSMILRKYINLSNNSNIKKKAKNLLKELVIVENKTYINLQQSNQITDYKKYIKQYPGSIYIDKAINRIAQIKLQKLKQKNIEKQRIKEQTYSNSFLLINKNNTINDYANFIKTYPKAPQVSEAVSKIFDIVSKKNTVKDYEMFIKKYSTSSQVKEAVSKIFTLLKKENNLVGYEEFIKNHPNTSQVNGAVSKIFDIVSKKNTVKDYEMFIKKYSTSLLIKKAVSKIYTLTKQKNTILEYENFINNYNSAPQTKDAISRIFNLLIKKDNIKEYGIFIKKHPNAPQIKDAISKIFNLIKQENNIIGYEWFIKKYSKAKEIKEAIKNIHKLAYQKAKEINTISSYNTFIILYPYASQLNEANKYSSTLEDNKYDNMKKDDERKARLLAVKIKKMTIKAKKSSNNLGYQIVINRMSNLLTTKYEGTDASLRYYESKEFTDFASKFESTMKDITNVLNQINSNTENLSKYTKKMIQISQDGFNSANVDRDMAAYHTEQKTK